MGKLRVLSGREVCQILSNRGFHNVRQHGSHIIMQKKRFNNYHSCSQPQEIKRSER